MNTPLPDRTRTLNGLTVDVEEHFQVSAFDGVVSRDSWAQRPSRVRDNTSRLLDLFDEQVRMVFLRDFHLTLVPPVPLICDE